MELKRFAHKLFNYFGLEFHRTKQAVTPREFVETYKRTLADLKKEGRQLNVFEKFRYNAGDHPRSIRELECEFASQHIGKMPQDLKILDVGSYREFILGISARSEITTLDVRKRISSIINEKVVTSDAKKMLISDDTFDLVVSLSSIEHFGLGRYGDDIDLDADKKAVSEMRRVLKPGGRMIFTVPVVKINPAVAFNCERVYNLDMINEFHSGMKKIEEKFYSRTHKSFVTKDMLSEDPKKWDVYMGAWEK